MDDNLIQAELDDIRVLVDRCPMTLPGNATILDYQRVTRSLQLDLQKLQERTKALLDMYSELEEELVQAKRSKGSRTTLVGEEKQISLAGGKFAMMNELWLSEVVLLTLRPTDVDPMMPSRYNSDYAKNLGAAEELYDALSPSLQAILADDNRRSSFIKTFLKQHGQERHNAIARLRDCASHILPYSGDHFTQTSNNQDVPGIHGLITDPATGKYDEFPPLLFGTYG
ncbi:hypothetical protein OF83DRAFT_1180747, partial [Amylostereum chailletii]